jgi:hypothetical protein
MKKNIFFFAVFIVPVLSFGQTNVELGLGYLRNNFSTVSVVGDLSSPYKVWESVYPHFTIYHQLNYRYSVISGAGIWSIGYDTKGNVLQDYGLPDQAQISNRWKQTMLKIPVGIAFSPANYRNKFAFGIEISVPLKSTLWDLKDQNYAYLVTDVTSAMPVRTWVFSRFMFYVSKRIRIDLNYKFNPFQWFSGKAADLAEANAIQQHAYFRPYYSTGILNDLNINVGADIAVKYRLF